MSRVYFHSEHGDAELRGSERAHLALLADEHALTTLPPLTREQARRVAGLIRPDHWLHTPMPTGAWESHLRHGLVGGILGPSFTWRGHTLEAATVVRNTAIRHGDDTVKLAARLHAQCEIHTWVDAANRAWLADIMQTGLDTGVYRRGLDYQAADGTVTRRSQGWEDVIALLRARDDGPVVTSSSFCDQFPNRDVAAWELPPMPADWAPHFANPEHRRVWLRDHPDEAERREWYAEECDDWEVLPDAEKWRLGMEGLRADADSWLELTPDNWETFYFRQDVTLQDLIADDYAERLDRAFGLDPAKEPA